MSESMYDCIGVGIIALDHLMVVDSYPLSNSKNKIREYAKQGGGPVPTALATLGKLGKRTALVAKIGHDPAAEFLMDELERYHVNIKYLRMDATILTPESFIIIDRRNGERTVFLNRDKQARLELPDIQQEIFQNCSLVHIDGHDSDVSMRIVEWARAMHIPVSLDIGSFRPIPEDMLDQIDYAIVSESYADSALIPGDPLESCKKLCKRGIKIAGVTCGARGCYFATATEHLHQPAYKIDARDTTGAGDVFHGAALYAVLEGFDLKRIAQFASAAAALKCRSIGGKAGIPDLDEIKNFIQSNSRFE
jgi:sulfofructose kinase